MKKLKQIINNKRYEKALQRDIDIVGKEKFKNLTGFDNAKQFVKYYHISNNGNKKNEERSEKKYIRHEMLKTTFEKKFNKI